MAKKSLLIVESPSKAKTIGKYLGSKYHVEASVGHIKDLIKSKIGVDVENSFEPQYVTIKGKADLIKKLKDEAKKADNVIIATDPDREGEAIAWHIANELKASNPNIERALFNEITKKGIEAGLKELKDIDYKLFMAQQARRVMDRLIGYEVSPFVSRALIDKTVEPLSAGRVQSVALRLICERELEIQKFVPIDYWNVNGIFSSHVDRPFLAKLVTIDNKSLKNPAGSAIDPSNEKLNEQFFLKNEEDATSLLDSISAQTYAIGEIKTRQAKRRPQAPYTTSTLQQESSRRLGFTSRKTMQLAQKLYEGSDVGNIEGGLITYMRTDSTRVSPEAQNSARAMITHRFGENYIPEVPPVYAKSAAAQDAHEAVRPTDLNHTPEKVRQYLDKDSFRLYELIYNRFLASQMAPAIIDTTSVLIKGGRFGFRAAGSIIRFDGFLAAYGDWKESEKNNEENAVLPSNLKEGLDLELIDANTQKSSTKPKPRFNEASLVKELDELGIGRPSTYAAIISTITDREYVILQNKYFTPTEIGMALVDVLIKSLPELFNVGFTAEMEKELDTIADGEKSYVDALTDFYGPFKTSLTKAKQSNVIEDIPCSICGAPMEIKVSRRGRFLGCSKYPECTNTMPLKDPNKAEKLPPVIAEGIFCEECGAQMLIRRSKYGEFLGCSNYPKCKNIKPIGLGIKCPKCESGDIIERSVKKSRKKFYGCSAYPKCDFISNFKPVNTECPKCHNNYLEVRFKKEDEVYHEFHKCPKCNEEFEISGE